MKKYIFSLIVIVSVMSACKKDAINTNKNNKGTTPVTFNIGFAQTTGSFSVSNKAHKFGTHSLASASVDSTLKANASTLYIVVYPADGSHLFFTKQLSTDTVFGKVQYNLPAGTYTVAFAAGQTGLNYGGTNLSSDDLVYSIPLSGGNFDNSWKDTFFKKMTITVGSTPVNQSVSLDRIDSQIIVNIEDAIPSTVKFIRVTASDNNFDGSEPSFTPYFIISTATATGDPGVLSAYTSLTIPVTPGVKNTKFAFFTLNSIHPYIVRIVGTDHLPVGNFNGVPNATGQQIGYAEVDSVMVVPGHQTVLSGNLFGGNGLTNTGGFNINVNPTWSPTTTTIPFQ